MEHKSNSYKVNRQQREKVLRYSIRKYSFGAASVAVAALMFLGARVASADSVSENTAPSAAGVVSPKDEPKSPQGIAEPTENKVDAGKNSSENQALTSAVNDAPTVDKAKLKKVVEELNSLLSTKLNLDDSVVSPVKDRLQKGKEALENSELAQKDIDELVELLSKDVTVVSVAAKESTEVQVDKQVDKTEKQAEKPASQPSSEVSASEESQTVSAKKDSLKVSVDQLQAAVLELPEHETSKEVLEKANELLGVAQGVLENTTVSLNEVEEMTKRVKRMFNSVKIATMRLTSGSHDPRNGQNMGQGSDLRSAPIDKTTKQGRLGIVVADSGFITGYATPSSTIEIKRNGQKILTSKLDDTGAFKLNAPGIKLGDKVELVVNGQSVYNTTVSQVDTVSFNDSLVGIAQVDGYTATEADVEISIGGKKYTTKSQSNGYFTVNVDKNLMVKDATITAVVKKNGKVVGSGTSNVRETRVTDFGVGWNKNPMLNYSERDVFSPDTKQYAFVSKGTADKAYDNIRVYREERIEKDGNKYYYWMLDSGPAANARAGSSKKISLAIPRTVGDPYDFTYTKYVNGQQTSHEEHPSARDWEYKNSNYRAYAKNGERRSGSTVNENIISWMDYIEPSNGWYYNIYRNSRDGANRNPDAATRVNDMLGIGSNGLRYHLVRGVIEDKLYIAAGQRTIITFKTKILEGNELDQSIMSDWANKNANDPMLAEIKKRLANDPYLAYGGYTSGGYDRYKDGQNAIIGTLPLKPEEAARYDLKPKSKPQSTKVGVIPDAYNSIANPNELPAGTTYRWFKDPDVSRPTAPNAPVYGKVEVTIPERGKFIVDAPVHVVDDKAQTPVATAKDNGDVTAKPQDPKKVDKIKVSFTGEDNKQKTAEGTKGTNGKWTVNNPDVRIDPNTGEITIPANKVKDLTEVTAVTKNGNGADSDPAKATAKDVQKPQATLNGVTLTETANTPIFTVYRGAEFNPELKVWDNSGTISKVTVGNLPGGVRPSSFAAQTGKDGSSEDKKYTTRLSSGSVVDTQTLGEHIGTLHVEGSSPADSRDLKFKYRVVDITTKNLEDGIAKVPVGSTLNVQNSRTNVDAHNYLKVVDSNDQRDRGNSYLPQGMVWTWKSGDKLDEGTTLDNSGKYTRNAVAKFPTGTNSITDTNSTTRTTFAPAEIKRQVVLAVTPTAPSVVANKDGSVEITPPKRPNSNTPQDIDTITLTYTPTGKTAPETVKVTKTGNNWIVNGKTTDKVSVTPQGVVKIADLEVADGKEVTAKVSKTIDNNVVLESPVAKQNAKDAQKPTLTITPSSQTVVEGEKVEFIVTAKDNTSVTLNAKDFLDKYFGRMNAGKATSTPVKTTETEKVVRISITTSAEDIGKQNTITFNAADNDGNNADPVNFNFTVTARDTVGPTITANGATVTKNEPITPISVTAVDNPGGVGLRDKNPIEVTGLPTGLTYANNRITGTPTAGKGDYPVTITAHDKNGNSTTTNITIKVQEQADAHNPRGERLTVDQNHVIEDSEVIAKVKDYAPATQLIVKSKPTTAVVGNPEDAVVTVTYPDGSSEDVNVPVTVRDASVPDTEGPTITANGATVTKNEPIKPILVTAVDNPGGVGLRDDNPIVVEGLPNGLTFKDEKITGTPTAPAGDYPVTIKAFDKKGNSTTTTITIKVQEQKDKHNPTAEGLTVNQGQPITDDAVKAKVKNYGPGTLTVQSKPNSTATAGNAGNAVITVTYPDGSSEEVTVPVTVKDVTGPTITAEGATVTKNEPITPIPVTVADNEGGRGLREENPVEVTDLPEGLTYANGQITGTPTAPKGDYTVTIKAHDKDGNVTTQTITIKVQEQADKYNPKYDDGNGIPGAKVEVPVTEETGKTIPEGTKFESLTPGITVDDKGKVTVTIPEDKEPGDEIPGTIKVTYPDGSKEEVPVKVTVTTPDKDIYTPEYDKENGKPGGTVELPLKEKDGKTIPEGTKFESNTPGITVDKDGKVTVTIPEGAKPGDKITGEITVTYPDGSTDTVPVEVTVTNQDKDIYTPEYDKENGKPGGTVELPLKEKDGKKIPEGTKFESNTPGITVDKDGKVTVTIPEGAKPGDKITGEITVTYPDGSTDTVPVEVTVTNQDKDIYTPEYDKENGKPGGTVELPLKEKDGKTIPEGTKFESNTPGITVDKDGKVTVTIPEGAKPGDKITGEITVTYPDGSKDIVPVEVTVTNQDKDIYTPEYDKENGKPGGTVELPLKEKDGKTIPEGTKFESNTPGITVDKDGKVTVTIPEGAKPGDKITGEITVTYPDGSKDIVPVEVTVTNQDKDIYTPEYDKENGKPGGTVELPLKEKDGKKIPSGTKFESNTPGITVDKDGKVTVTIPEGAKPGDKITGEITVTYPDGSTDTVPVEVTVTNQDKDIYTPEYDKENGKPGGTVELPLKEKDGKTIPEGTKFESNTPGITVDKDGKVTVTIPEGAKPGDKITGEITVTYPDGSKDIVPVEVTVTNQDKDIYTPEYDKENGKPGGTVELPLKEKDGKTIPEGTKFESNTPGITVDKDGKVTVTIPEGAKPGDKITGEITVTYPDGSKDIVPVEVTVTNQDKDIYTPEYDKENGKPGGTVELPLKEKDGKKIPSGTKFESNTPGITVDKDGKVTVTIPEGAKPGDKITGEITVTYPDGSTDTVPVEVTVTNQDKDIYTPEYDKENGKPGTKVEIPLKEETGKKIPSGTKFESNTPGITVDKDGKVTVTIPEGAKPGDKITGEITVTYPDGSTDTVPVEVTVTNQDKDIYTPEYDKENGKPGTKVEIPLKEEAGKTIPEGTKFESNTPGITVDKDGKVTVTIPEGAKPGDKITGEITVTYPDGSKDIVPVEVTVTNQDKDIYTPEYDKENGKPGTKVEIPLKEKDGKKIPSGTKFESNTPGITVDKDGKVTVTIPEGAKPGDKITGEITVTYPDGSKDIVPVEVTVTNQDKDIYTPEYDKENGKPGTKVEIPLKEEAGKTIPEGTKFESNTPGITVDKDGKVTVTIPEGAKPGDKITGEITVTYPDGSTDTVPVEVTVTNQDKDIYTPEYDKENGKPGTKVEIPLKEEAGKTIPEGTKFESNTPGITVDKDGKVTVTIPEGAKPGDKITGEITVTYPDGSTDTVPVEVTVTNQDKDIYTPEYDKENGKPGGTVELPLKEKDGKKIPSGTKFESNTPGITVDKDGKVTVTIPEGAKPGDKITGEITVTYPDGSKDIVPVEVTVTNQDKDIYTPEYDKENGKPGTKVEIPLKEETGKKIPSGTKFESNTPGITVDKDGKVTVTIPEGAKPGDKITGEITVTYPDGSTDTVPVEVTVTNQDKDIYTPEYDKENGKPGTKVEIPLKEEAGKTIPEGTKFESNTPGITVDKDGKVTVTIPEGAKPGDKITGEITVTYPDGSKDIVPVEVTVTNQDKDIYTPEYDKENGKPGTKVEIPLKEKDGKKIPSGTKFESNTPGITVDKDGKVTVTIPEGAKPGDKITGEITVTYPDGSKDIVPVEVTVTNQDKDIYTPEYDKENGKPGTKVEIPLKEEAGKTIPEGTKFESNTPGITVDKDGKVTVTIPEGAKPGDKITGEITVTYPDGSTDTVPVEVTVTNQDKDIYTPEYDKENGKPGTKVEIPLKEEAGKTIPEGTKFESNTPGITVDKDGKVTVTIPEGAKPGDKITGEITVTYPDGSTDTVPVEVTVTNQDKDIYTPEYDKENGKPGGTVELPLKEKDGKKIPSGTKFESNTPGITVDKDGKVTVTIPEGAKPGDKITGEITVTYPDGSKDIVPVEVTVTNQDKDIYTPEYDKENGKPGTKVEIPLKEEAGKTIPEGTKFESNTPGITVDKDGKVTVTIPEGAKPGDKITGEITVTYPDGSTDTVPVEVTVTNQDKDIYTPEYDKENGKPGTKVEIPLKEEAGKTIPEGTKFESNTPGITVDKDGKVTVTIPEGAKPGDKITGEITVTYPDGSTDTVPVEVTVTNQDKDIYTPEYDKENGKPGGTVELPLKEKDGKKIPSGTKFESNTPGITVDKDGKVTVTIPEGAKPGDKITGEITVTYPDGSKDIVPVEVTVTNQDKDIYTPEYDKENGKPGGTVELPLKEKDGKTIPEGTKFQSNTPGITVDKDGKVTVTIPEGAKPGDKITGEITVTYPDGSTDTVPVEVTVTNQDKDIYTPKYEDGNGKPGAKVEIPLTEESGKKIPEGTTFESDQPGVITVDKDGKVTVTIPEGAKPGDKITGKVIVRYPDGSTDTVPVEVTVTNQDKDIYTPEYDKENGKPGGTVELPLKEKDGKKIPSGTKFQSNTPGITVDKDGKVTVTIPEGAKPGDKITGEITVTYPDGSTDTVPVEVTVTNQDKDIYTPKYEDGNGKPGAKVEIPLTEESGKKIPEGTTFESDQPGVITVDKDGKVTVTIPEGAKPGDKITGKVIVRYPDGSTEEIPVTVTVTPNADQVDTKTTMDNGANSNDSQNVLPNTGTESNATLASLGLLGLLSGFGLVARKKKED